MQSPHQVWQPWFQVVWGWRPVCVFHWIWPTWSNCLDLASSHRVKAGKYIDIYQTAIVFWNTVFQIHNIPRSTWFGFSIYSYLYSGQEINISWDFKSSQQKSTTKVHNKSPQQKSTTKVPQNYSLFEQTSSPAVSILWPISSDKR